MTSYNAKDCSIVFNSVYLTGLAEEMVNGAKDEELYSATVGAQGDVVVNEINNNLGTVSVTLQATSPVLGWIIEQAKAGTIAPLWVNNLKLGRTFGGTQARIKNLPELTMAQEAEDVSVEFGVFDFTEK